MKRNNIYIMVMALGCLLASCAHEVGITTPDGPKGKRGPSLYEIWLTELKEGKHPNWSTTATTLADYFKFIHARDLKNAPTTNGQKGADGKSAYEEWKAYIKQGVPNPHNPNEEWPKDKDSRAAYYDYLTGASGETGPMPHVDPKTGRWFVGKTDTGITAKGEKGRQGDNTAAMTPPRVEVENGYWKINGTLTNVRAVGEKGQDGTDATKPTIKVTDDGFWEINGEKQQIKATGEDGTVPTGADGKIAVDVSDKKTWVIDGTDTGITIFGAKGAKGDDGEHGKSAYEMWLEYIKDGNADNPAEPGQKWPATKNTERDFWEYILGFRKYKEQVFKYAIVPVYYNQTKGEMVNPADGSVLYQLYTPQGVATTQDIQIMAMPGIPRNPNNEPLAITDREGRFLIPASKLPVNKPLAERTGAAELILTNGDDVTTAAGVVVPNKVEARATIQSVERVVVSQDPFEQHPIRQLVKLKVERNLNDQESNKNSWEAYPLWIPVPSHPTNPVLPLETDPQFDIYRDPIYAIQPITDRGTVTGYQPVLKICPLAEIQGEEPAPTLEYTIALGDELGELPDYGTKLEVPEPVDQIKLSRSFSTSDNLKFFVDEKKGYFFGEINISDVIKTYKETNTPDFDNQGGAWHIKSDNYVNYDQMEEDRRVCVYATDDPKRKNNFDQFISDKKLTDNGGVTRFAVRIPPTANTNEPTEVHVAFWIRKVTEANGKKTTTVTTEYQPQIIVLKRDAVGDWTYDNVTPVEKKEYQEQVLTNPAFNLDDLTDPQP